jgi:uncharacterized protein YndB with AHSA1/START domain
VKTHDDGVLTINVGSYELRFERIYPFPVDQVWAALTEPGQLRQWFADGDLTGAAGDQFRLRYDHTGDVLESRIIRTEAPRLLEFNWQWGNEPASIVRWELAPDPAGTKFTLTHAGLAFAELDNTAPGWHAHLELLAALLNGEPAPWSWDRFNTLKEQYAAQRKEQGVVAPVAEPASAQAS